MGFYWWKGCTFAMGNSRCRSPPPQVSMQTDRFGATPRNASQRHTFGGVYAAASDPWIKRNPVQEAEWRAPLMAGS